VWTQECAVQKASVMRFIINRKSEFIIYQFIINDTIVYPLGGEGGYDEN
jgi:hypothetical protein